MRYLLDLAFRNVLRNKKRTFFTAFAIAIGLMFIILTDSIMTGIDQDSFKKIIDFETGHVKIFSQGYKDETINSLQKNILTSDKVFAEIKNNPEIEAWAPRITFSGMLSNGIDQLPIIGIGIDTEQDKTVFSLSQTITKGNYIKGTEEGMVIGQQLAEDFGVGVGDYLTVLTRTRFDTYQALDLPIEGIISTEDPQVDRRMVIMPLSFVQASLDMNNRITEIDIKLKNANTANKFAQIFASKTGKNLETASWEELAEDIVKISQMKTKFSSIILFAVVIVALVGITNTVLMGAFERMREIGTMMAMGMNKNDIIKLFVMEGGMIGILGGALGCALGAAVNVFFIYKGIDYTSMLKDIDMAYRTTGIMHGTWNIGTMLKVFIIGAITSVIVSIYPAWLASKFSPNEALKHV